MEEKQKDNLKQLLVGCKPIEATLDQEKTSTQLELAGQLEELGFKDPAKKIMDRIMYLEKLAKTSQYKYIRVMPSRIHKFLHDKATRYNQEHSIKEPKIEIKMSTEKIAEIVKQYAYVQMQPEDRVDFQITGYGTISLSAEQYQKFIAASKKDDDKRADEEKAHLELMQDVFYEQMKKIEGRNQMADYAHLIDKRMFSDDLPDPVMTIDPAIDSFRKKGIDYSNPHIKISVKTKDYNSTDPKTIGKFVYTETPVSEYPDIPPNDVLQVMKTHKDRKIFDYFSIAKVTHIVDPIMFGRINGCEDRFYIAQWGNDITLDDIL